MATAGRGATGPSSPTTGGRNVGSRHRQPDQKLEAPRVQARAHSPSVRNNYLSDLAPHTADLAKRSAAGGVLRRPGRADDSPALRRDPGVLVRPGTPEARGRTRRSLEGNRRTRLDTGTCPRLAEWLRRVARVHAHLCAIVRLYGSPSRAGGQSLQGETYAAKAARGDRTLLYDAITLSVDELVEIRDGIQTVIDAAVPTSAPAGSKDKVLEMARRAERGESLFVDGDGSRPADGSAG